MAALQPAARVVWNMAVRFGRLLNIRLKLNKNPYNLRACRYICGGL